MQDVRSGVQRGAKLSISYSVGKKSVYTSSSNPRLLELYMVLRRAVFSHSLSRTDVSSESLEPAASNSVLPKKAFVCVRQQLRKQQSCCVGVKLWQQQVGRVWALFVALATAGCNSLNIRTSNLWLYSGCPYLHIGIWGRPSISSAQWHNGTTYYMLSLITRFIRVQ